MRGDLSCFKIEQDLNHRPRTICIQTMLSYTQMIGHILAQLIEESCLQRTTCTIEANLKCPECPKKCKTKTILKKHLKLHDGQKPSKCQFCEKIFKKKEKKNRHEILRHNQGTYYWVLSYYQNLSLGGATCHK